MKIILQSVLLQTKMYASSKGGGGGGGVLTIFVYGTVRAMFLGLKFHSTAVF